MAYWYRLPARYKGVLAVHSGYTGTGCAGAGWQPTGTNRSAGWQPAVAILAKLAVLVRAGSLRFNGTNRVAGWQRAAGLISLIDGALYQYSHCGLPARNTVAG